MLLWCYRSTLLLLSKILSDSLWWMISYEKRMKVSKYFNLWTLLSILTFRGWIISSVEQRDLKSIIKIYCFSTVQTGTKENCNVGTPAIFSHIYKITETSL
jgi:hypothetical protein